MVTEPAKSRRTTAKKQAPMKPAERTRLAEEAVLARVGVTDSAPTSASAWKAGLGGTLLRVPSGNTCRVKTNVGMESFLTRGKIPNGLMSIITDAMNKAKGSPGAKPTEEDVDIDVASFLEDPDKLRDLVDLANSICLDVVLEPKVTAVPPEGQPRDPNLLYVDEVDFADKMYIFNFVVGGTADLDKFRF